MARSYYSVYWHGVEHGGKETSGCVMRKADNENDALRNALGILMDDKTLIEITLDSVEVTPSA